MHAVVLTGYDVVGQKEKQLYFASLDFSTSHFDPVLPDVCFVPLLAGDFAIRRGVSEPDRLFGISILGFGAFTIENQGEYDYLSRWEFSRRPVQVYYSGGKPRLFSDLKMIWNGIIQDRPSVTDRGFEFRIQPCGKWLDDNIQRAYYLGNNVGQAGHEGGDNLTGRPKPRCWGACFGIEPTRINDVSLVFQVADHPVKRIVAVYDNGNKLENAGDIWDLGYFSVDEWPQVPGQFVTDTGAGKFRLGSPAIGTVTADAEGRYIKNILGNQILTDFDLTVHHWVTTNQVIPQVYQFPGYPIVAFSAVYDNGVPLTNDGDISTLGLDSVTVWPQVPGHFVTDIERSQVKVGSAPSGPVTADLEIDVVVAQTITDGDLVFSHAVTVEDDLIFDLVSQTLIDILKYQQGSTLDVYENNQLLQNIGDIADLGLTSLAVWTPVPGQFVTDRNLGLFKTGHYIPPSHSIMAIAWSPVTQNNTSSTPRRKTISADVYHLPANLDTIEAVYGDGLTLSSSGDIADLALASVDEWIPVPGRYITDLANDFLMPGKNYTRVSANLQLLPGNSVITNETAQVVYKQVPVHRFPNHEFNDISAVYGDGSPHAFAGDIVDLGLPNIDDWNQAIGQYVTDMAKKLVFVGSAFARVSADMDIVQSEKNLVETTSGVIADLVTEAEGSVNQFTIAAHKISSPGCIGVYSYQDVSYRSLIETLAAASGSLVTFNQTCELSIYQLTAPGAPTRTIQIVESIVPRYREPYFKLGIAYQKHSEMSGGQGGGSSGDSGDGKVDSGMNSVFGSGPHAGLRSENETGDLVAYCEDQAVQVIYRGALDGGVLASFFSDKSSAQFECDRQFELFSTPSEFLEVQALDNTNAWEIGETVTVAASRWGLQGAAFVIVGLIPFATGINTVYMWRPL